jgi:hypothetical protein
MLYAGLDLSRQRLDVHVLDKEGQTIEVTAVIESMNGGPLRPRPARAVWLGRRDRRCGHGEGPGRA